MAKRRITNARITVTADNEKSLSVVIDPIRKEQKDNIIFETPIKENTRPPFELGVHQMLYLSLGEDSPDE